MATAKTQTETQTTIQDATAQVQDLAERFVESSKKAAAEYITLTEKAAESVVGLQREVAAKSEVEWVTSLIDAQAKLTAEVTKVLVSSSRELIK